MNRLFFILALALVAGVAFAQNAPSANPPVGVAGAYNSGTQTCTSGQGCWLQTDVNGNLKVTTSSGSADPCSGAKTYTSDASQTASTRYVTGSVGKKTYVCQVFIFANAAETVSIVEGTGSTCGTNTHALYGNATVASGLGISANGGFSIGAGAAGVQASPNTGTDICVLQAGSSRVNVSIVTVQQ